MELTFEDQLNDLDWFAVDGEGAVGHFTTAGAVPLPRCAARSKENLERLVTHFLAREACTAAVIDPDALANAGMLDSDAASRDWFFGDFLAMARRGLYSYNVFMRTPPAAGYYRVAVPSVPLHVDQLPAEIRALLGEVRFETLSFGCDTLVTVP